jgi:3-hydroxymyristoyl/3-hydroxydecanoyl-(acyl carrier protein) dehydratase
MADGESALAGVAVADGAARAAVRPAHAHRLCDGHFPGDPLMPGAALVGLMAELAAQLVARPGAAPAEIVRAAFFRRVTPHDPIVVAARVTSTADRRGIDVDSEVRVRGRFAARAVLHFGERR